MKSLFILLLPTLVNAAPITLNFQARIRDNSGHVLENSNVTFFFQYTSPDGSCVLFEETYENQNMIGSGGLVNFQLGLSVDNPTVNYKKVFSSGDTLKDTFKNSGTYTCKDGSTYTPLATDIRKMTVKFQYPLAVVGMKFLE